MAENLTTALLIMVIGMGVVFASILLLWGMMALLVRLTTDQPRAEPAAEDDLTDLHQKAAAAAVAVARQRAISTMAAQVVPPTAVVSPWQAVMRARQYRQRGPIR